MPTPEVVALRVKIRPDEAESKSCSGTTVKDENEVWPDCYPSNMDSSPVIPDFTRNPEGRGSTPPSQEWEQTPTTEPGVG